MLHGWSFLLVKLMTYPMFLAVLYCLMFVVLFWISKDTFLSMRSKSLGNSYCSTTFWLRLLSICTWTLSWDIHLHILYMYMLLLHLCTLFWFTYHNPLSLLTIWVHVYCTCTSTWHVHVPKCMCCAFLFSNTIRFSSVSIKIGFSKQY